MIFKIKTSQFYNWSEPTNEKETKSDILSREKAKSYTKILNYFKGFHNCHLSILLQKWSQTKIKTKRNLCKSDLTSSYLQSSTLFKWLFRFIFW